MTGTCCCWASTWDDERLQFWQLNCCSGVGLQEFLLFARRQCKHVLTVNNQCLVGNTGVTVQLCPAVSTEVYRWRRRRWLAMAVQYKVLPTSLSPHTRRSTAGGWSCFWSCWLSCPTSSLSVSSSNAPVGGVPTRIMSLESVPFSLTRTAAKLATPSTPSKLARRENSAAAAQVSTRSAAARGPAWTMTWRAWSSCPAASWRSGTMRTG